MAKAEGGTKGPRRLKPAPPSLASILVVIDLAHFSGGRTLAGLVFAQQQRARDHG